MSVKDFHLPMNSTTEQMEAFKAKLAAADVNGYILGPIYMNSKADADRAFEYVKRYGADIFIGGSGLRAAALRQRKIKEYNVRMAIHTHARYPNIPGRRRRDGAHQRPRPAHWDLHRPGTHWRASERAA